MTPELQATLTLIEHGGVVTLSLYLWWYERKERLKLADKLEACLEARAEHNAGDTRLTTS